MADLSHIHNEFSLICGPHNVNGEAMTQPNTYPYHKMSHLLHEQYRNNTVPRADNFHQNAHMPYYRSAPTQGTTSDYNEWNQTASHQCTIPIHDFLQSVPNQSTTSDYNEWGQTVSNPCAIPNHNFYQSVPNPESTTSDCSWHQSTSRDNNPYHSIPNRSTTSNYDSGFQHVNSHEVINIPAIENDDCKKSERMFNSNPFASMKSVNLGFPNQIKERKCTRFTPEQAAILESAYEGDKDPDSCTRGKLATVFQVNERKIYGWFKYRRTNARKDAEK